MRPSRTSKVALAGACFAQLALARAASAQAWLPPKGEGNFLATYQNLFARDHWDFESKRFDAGPVKSHSVILDVELALTDRLALNLGLPYVASKYEGEFAHPNEGNTDDGSYHGAIQDFRVGARYSLRTRPLAITPFAELTIPSHHYEIFAHSAIGKDLRGLAVGANLGGFLDPVLPRAYFQIQYSYTVVQRVEGIRPNRSRLGTEIGYFVTPRLALRALGSLLFTHTGLDFPKDFSNISDERHLHHDQITKDRLLSVGGGVAFVLGGSWDVFAFVLAPVWGRNGHAPLGVTVGFNRHFRTARSVAQVSPSASASLSQRLIGSR